MWLPRRKKFEQIKGNPTNQFYRKNFFNCIHTEKKTSAGETRTDYKAPAFASVMNSLKGKLVRSKTKQFD